MSDQILEKLITIAKVEKTMTANGKTLIKFKDGENKSYQLWPIKQDGTESIAYQAYKILPMDGIGKSVLISYKEQQGDFNGKPVVYRSIIGIKPSNAIIPPKPKENEIEASRKSILREDSLAEAQLRKNEAIKSFQEIKDEGMRILNAKNIAGDIVVALLNRGVMERAEIEDTFQYYTDFIYNYQPK